MHAITAPDLAEGARAAGLSATGVDPRVTAVEVRDFDARSDTDRLRKASRT